jgi:hypothetical protein
LKSTMFQPAHRLLISMLLSQLSCSLCPFEIFNTFASCRQRTAMR